MGLGHSPRIVTDGLVLCLDAANKRSYPGTGTTWTDMKGGNNGTLTNGPTFSSDNGGHIAIDGTNDSIDMSADSITPSLPVSLSCWVYFDNTGSWVRLFHTSSGSSIYSGLWMQKSYQDKFSIAFGDNLGGSDGGYRRTKNSTQSLDIGRWLNLVAIVRGATDMDLYVDGVNYAGGYSGTGGSLDYKTGGVPRIGYINTSYGDSFKISEMLIYNKALTAQEVRQNYEATKGRYE